ncbi:ATP-binding cassette domain-containing protein [Virgisporangium ochraceum]
MIQTRNLTRHFGDVRAVEGLDLDVGAGELVALLGPNGAGKSTTLRMLTTLIAPTSGTARVAGHDVVTDRAAVRRSIGYIGQGNGAGHTQRGRDELVTQGRAYGMSRAAARSRAAELIESLDLGPVADRRVSTLSGGQRRRLDIAMGLIHAPRLLFLDEPSTGLDPQNRANLQEHIRALRERHATTVVLTTHYLDEADWIAERVIVVDHGRVIADAPPARLKAALGDRVTLGFASAPEAASAVALVGGVLDGTRVSVPAEDGPALVPVLLRHLDLVDDKVASAAVSQPTLDDVFLSLTGRSLREGVTA